MLMNDCIFCKIANHSIPTKLIYEDDDIAVFHDLYPKAKIHFLIIPKTHISSMLELEGQHTILIGRIMVLANSLAKGFGLDGYKVQVNTGESGGQEIFHLHVHVLGNPS